MERGGVGVGRGVGGWQRVEEVQQSDLKGLGSA
jgi:hypothetical protein